MFHRVRSEQVSDFAPNRSLDVSPHTLELIIEAALDLELDIISLDEVCERVRYRTPSRPWVAFTFDDAYRDNVVEGLPIFEKYDVPWAVFVTVGFASGSDRLWWIELEDALRRLEHVALVYGRDRLELPCATAHQKTLAYGQIRRLLYRIPEPHIPEVVSGITKSAGLDTTAFTERHCLTWNELRDLATKPKVTIGAHTLSHPCLPRLARDDAEREITECGRRIRQEIGRMVLHFSYPFGEAGRREQEMVRAAGYSSAVTTKAAPVAAADARLHALPRLEVDGCYDTTSSLQQLAAWSTLVDSAGFKLPRSRSAAVPS